MGSRKKGKRASERVHVFPEGEGPHEGRVSTMTFAEDMRDLTEQIINSRDAREAARVALRQQTAATLKDVRQQMTRLRHELGQQAADLKRLLGTTELSRLRDFRTMHNSIRAGQMARRHHLHGMLRECRAMVSGFRRAHEAAAEHWQHMAVAMARRRAIAMQ